LPNNVSLRIFSVATTSCSNFSYSASSLIKERMSGTSSMVAGLILNATIITFSPLEV
jgi:hypothetical protein